MLARVRIGLVAAAVATALSAGRAPAIGSLEVTRHEDSLRVSFTLEDAWSEELLERVEAGLELSFRHRVELLGRRVAWLFPRRTLARTVVETTLRYDALTGRYEYARRVVARRWPGGRQEAWESVRRSTESLGEARRWMTRLEAIPLPAPEVLSGPLRVRVRSTLDRKLVLGLFPWTRTASRETVWGS